MTYDPLHLKPGQTAQQRARDVLLRWIIDEEVSPGEKLPSQSQLVKALGCSARTVHEAISALAQEGIVESSIGRGTFLKSPPHQAPRVQLKRILIIAEIMTGRDWTSPLIEGAEMFFTDTQQDLTLIRRATPTDEEIIALHQETPLDGVLFLYSGYEEVARHYEYLFENLHIPFVSGLIGRPSTFFPHVGIFCDDDALTTKAVEALHLAGHNHLSLAASTLDTAWEILRINAFESWCKIRPSIKTNIFKGECREHEYDDGGKECFKQWHALPEDERPTAIFAVNDSLAFGFYEAAIAAGLSCPQDFSIIGIDNENWTPPDGKSLSSIDRSIHTIGRLAAEQLCQLAAGHIDEAGAIKRVPPRLLLRDSVAPLTT